MFDVCITGLIEDAYRKNASAFTSIACKARMMVDIADNKHFTVWLQPEMITTVHSDTLVIVARDNKEFPRFIPLKTSDFQEIKIQ